MSSWVYLSAIFMGVDVPVHYHKRVRGGFYRGSNLLNPVAEFMHVPLDQINYVACGLLTLVLGQLMRRYFPPDKTSPRRRALIEIALGFVLLAFCFGNQIRVLLLQSVVAYLLMVCFPNNHLMAVIVTIWSMLYMTLVHLCRLQYDYGGYTLDISGPVMVQTQRLSSLAFNLADGQLLKQNQAAASKRQSISPTGDHQTDPTSPNQSETIQSNLLRKLHSLSFTHRRLSGSDSANGQTRYSRSPSHHVHNAPVSSPKMTTNLPASHVEHAVDEMPGPVEFFAYNLHFHGVLVGPFIFYKEYWNYLIGYEKKTLPPVNWHQVIFLLVRLAASGLSVAYVYPYFHFDYVMTEAFRSLPLFHRILYSTFSLFLVRQKYYFAWGLAEANGVAIGTGYTGICPRTGRTLNRHVCNFDFVQVESAVGLKLVVDAWNRSTTRWLREVFYDRLPHSIRTLLVFMISAFWHGFYPGYYLMFSSFALFTVASRIWHRHCRAYFRQTNWSIRLYDLFTMILTNLIINYGQAPFHLLDLVASIQFWSNFYFVPHLIALGILFIPLVKTHLAVQPTSQLYSNHHHRPFKLQPIHDRSVGG